MNTVILRNEEITAEVSTHGAELCSVKDNKNHHEFLWCADPAYWGRHAPVLFPFVGTQSGKQYTYEGKSYPMGQHGFARDMEFTVESESESEVWMVLRANEETLEKYPFLFALHIGYRLHNRTIEVVWKVENRDHKMMYFAIGAHPAFNCPFSKEKDKQFYIVFHGAENLKANYIDLSCGLKNNDEVEIPLDMIQDGNGYLLMTDDLFSKDALIIEHTKINKVSLCNERKEEFVTVTFDAPLFGLWSPAKKGAPFVCIEPWYGRCDAVGFDGEISEKEYINELKAGEQLEHSYQMTFGCEKIS